MDSAIEQAQNAHLGMRQVMLRQVTQTFLLLLVQDVRVRVCGGGVLLHTSKEASSSHGGTPAHLSSSGVSLKLWVCLHKVGREPVEGGFTAPKAAAFPPG